MFTDATFALGYDDMGAVGTNGLIEVADDAALTLNGFADVADFAANGLLCEAAG